MRPLLNGNASPSYTINGTSGSVLNVNAGGISALSGAISQFFGSNISLNVNANQTWSNAGSGTIQINSRLTGANTLSLTAGTFQLQNSANTFSGALTLSGTATLNLNAGGALAHGNVTVNTGASLIGGSAFGTVKFTIAGAIAEQTVVSGGTYDITNLDLNINASGLTLPSYTLVNAAGGGTIAGTSFHSFTPVAGYNLVVNPGINGSVMLNAIPEPSSAALFALGVGALLPRKCRNAV